MARGKYLGRLPNNLGGWNIYEEKTKAGNRKLSFGCGEVKMSVKDAEDYLNYVRLKESKRMSEIESLMKYRDKVVNVKQIPSLKKLLKIK